MIDDGLVRMIRAQFPLQWNGIHGIPHWTLVCENGLRLAEVTGAKPRVTELFAFLHDSRRRTDGHDPEHGQRAAMFAQQIAGSAFHLEPADLELLLVACDELLAWSRKRDRSVSRATVYRTLPLLTESGLVREMDFGQDSQFYDPNYAERPSHNHIVCQDCQMIVEFESDQLEQIESEISQRLGFSLTTHRLQISARCEELKQHGTCKKKGSEPPVGPDSAD